MRYYISDLHGGHDALNDTMDHRGFASVDEMNRYMIKQWNGRVQDADEVMILGDLFLGRAGEAETFIRKLKGKKYLITGNHDRFLKEPSFPRQLFQQITPYMEITDQKRKVILSHYLLLFYHGQNWIKEDGEAVSYMLYGHLHDTQDEEIMQELIWRVKAHRREYRKISREIPCNLINCFCMFSDYIPLTLDEWIETDRKRRALFLEKTRF